VEDNLIEKWECAHEIFKEKIESQVKYNTWFKSLAIDSVKDNVVYLYVGFPEQQNILKKQYSRIIEETINIIFGSNYTYDISVKKIQKSVPTSKVQDYVPATNLNPKYTFESYIIGKSNDMAVAQAKAVAENPGKINNPLFLYSGVGLGKTHLMQAIGNHIIKHNPNAKVIYITSEKFTNEFIRAIEINKKTEFKSKYRNMDVLIIDDIQFLIGKSSTQEEFFHLFNELYENNKQIIISSDKPPKELVELEARLTSRFEMGFIADIQSPDIETRIAILKQKAKLDGKEDDFSNEVLYYLANKVTSNVRQLEGAIKRVIAYANLANTKPTKDIVDKALKEYVSQKPTEITIEYIQDIVADHYSIAIEDLKAKKRNQAIAFPRQIAMYLSRKLTDTSFPKIGEKFGGKDHSTVLHACNKIEEELEHNDQLKVLIETLQNKIKIV